MENVANCLFHNNSVVYFASYHYFVSAYKVPLPNIGACAAGKEHAVFSGCAILTSYLFLFIGE